MVGAKRPPFSCSRKIAYHSEQSEESEKMKKSLKEKV